MQSKKLAMKIHSIASVLALFLSFLQPAQGQNTLRVPEQYSKIQSAIDAAQSGDTVLVSPGIYVENLQLRGRDIVLSSRYYLETDPAAVIRQTIVDGSQPVHPDTASCLLIWKGESAATVVQGFTFRGGKGTLWLDPAGFGTFREGGGILTEFSSPTIRHNIIRENVVPAGGPGTVSYGGGGIRSGEGAVHIENNYIVHNRADGYGGGIVLNYCPNALVENNVIAFNYGGKDYSGGGFWATGQSQGTVVVLRNNTIAWNTTPPAAGANGGKGGGIFIFSITLQAENNIIWGNTQATGKQIGQGGAALQFNYNCVETGIGGIGNTSANPVFRDTVSFVLEAGSPAIDAGNPDAVFSDFSRNNRRAAFPARGARACDMGAYGGAEVKNPGCPESMQDPVIFSRVLNSPVVTTAGDSRSVNWIDMDQDADLDLFISNGPQAGENNFLYQNNGKGGFTPVSGQPIVEDQAPSDGATWGDFDNDGDPDCFVVNWYGMNNLLYKNNGDGTFEKISTGAPVTDGGYSETASWGDYDRDGLLDLYVTNSGGNKRNFLYHNDGNDHFTRILLGAPATDAATSRCVNWVDFDNDGDPDLFVTNEENQHENLYRNDGNGVFVKLNSSPLLSDGGKTMSASWGDFDNDGDPDVFLANDQGNDALFRNDNGNFVKITTGPVVTSGGNTFGSQWADVDNDGDLDLFVTHSFWGDRWQNSLFLNQGDGTFLRDTSEMVSRDLGWSYGCAFGDFDRDGDLDLGVATCYNANQTDYLYENHSAENDNRWLEVRCIGTISNRSAIGARVSIKTWANGMERLQIRDISAQSGYCGQNQLDAHFGLGAATSIDTLEIVWPSGMHEYFTEIQPDQFITITEGQGITKAPVPAQAPPLRIQPNPFTDSITVGWNMPEMAAVNLKIIDLQGNTIYFRQEKLGQGPQEWLWNGKDSTGNKAPAGVYFVYLNAHDWSASAKIIRE